MSTSYTMRAHAQEVLDRSDKIKGSCQSGRKVVTHDSKRDLALAIFFQNHVNTIHTIRAHMQEV